MKLPYVVSVVLTLSWGLWFGGLITLFLAVTTIFDLFSPDRHAAGRVAAAIFMAFEQYQLILAGVALLSAGMFQALQRSNLSRVLIVLLALSGAGALVSTMVISPRIDTMRREQRTDTPEFRKLHGRSMMVYSSQALILGIAGMVLPAALQFNASPRPSRSAELNTVLSAP